MPGIAALGKLRYEDHKYKGSLDYTGRPDQKHIRGWTGLFLTSSGSGKAEMSRRKHTKEERKQAM